MRAGACMKVLLYMLYKYVNMHATYSHMNQQEQVALGFPLEPVNGVRYLKSVGREPSLVCALAAT